MPKLVTWTQLKDTLGDLPDEVQTLIRKGTAGLRHERRVILTEDAVRGYVAGLSNVHPTQYEKLATSLLVLDANGIGGRLGLGAGFSYVKDDHCYGEDNMLCSTSRMPWAWQLGSGRRQAVDGGAWFAALRSLIQDRCQEYPATLSPEDVNEALDLLPEQDRPWIHAYVRRQLVELSRYISKYLASEDDQPPGYNANVVTTTRNELLQWAAVYERLCPKDTEEKLPPDYPY